MNEEPVTDPSDPRIEVFLGLRDHVARQARERPGGDRAGSFIAEGDVVIERALAAGHRLESLVVDAARTKPLPDAIDPATPVYAAGPEVLTVITGRPELRDPLACFVRPPPREVDAVLERAKVVAVLEGINNPNNLGVIMRNAAGLGVDGVLLDPTCGDPLYRRAIRASMGQVFAISHARLDTLPDGLAPLHERGFTTVALSPEAELDLTELEWSEPVAFVLGAEGPGLTAKTMTASSATARIGMARAVDSLNVASAAAIAFHHAASMRKTPPSRLKA